MVSAMSLHAHNRRPPRRWPHWALDSGGFIALRRAKDYPFSPDEYLAAVNAWKPTWAASMDFPCEPELCAESGRSVQENIAATVEYARYLCARDGRIVPVLQGYTAKEYEECWRLLPKTGRVAIGSVCRRQSLAEISELVRCLAEFVDARWRHGFGVKILALRRPEPRAFFTSVDSNAWEFAILGNRRRLGSMTTRHKLNWAQERYGRMLDRLRTAPLQLTLVAPRPTSGGRLLDGRGGNEMPEEQR